MTDDSAAVKPPWVFLAFTVCLLALVMPREVLPEFGLASALVGACYWLVKCWRVRAEYSADEALVG